LSEIRATTISDAAGTGPITLTKQSAAKAWVRYNQIGNSINTSFNVSSMTDTATGDSDVNFTSSLSAADHPAPTNQSFSSGEMGVYSHNNAANKTRVLTRSNSSTNVDRHYNMSQLGDLA